MTHNIKPKKRESALEKSIDKWIVLNITGNGNVIGFLKEVNGREITLNPYRAWRYDKTHNCNLYTLIKENSYVEVSPNGYLLEPTNLETINYSIQELNEGILKGKKDASKNSVQKNK